MDGAVTTYEDFPETWRYVPLRLIKRQNGTTTWVNAFAYEEFRKSHRSEKLGSFGGFDVSGKAYFGGMAMAADDVDLSRDFIPEWAERDGCAVGIFVEYCTPELVIIDCDSDVKFVGDGNTRRVKTIYGHEQLLDAAERRGKEIPRCPLVRGNRDGHRYLIFRQNTKMRVSRRLIRPFGYSIDVVARGHQLHWTAGNRELLDGRDLLLNPPEMPLWLVRMLQHDTVAISGTRMKPGSMDVNGGGALVQAFIDATLRPVTRTGSAWNQRLFNAACTLFETGVEWEVGLNLVLERAEPETSSDRHSAQLSIASAWRKTTGEAVPE